MIVRCLNPPINAADDSLKNCFPKSLSDDLGIVLHLDLVLRVSRVENPTEIHRHRRTKDAPVEFEANV
jgi:hypothetical protein